MTKPPPIAPSKQAYRNYRENSCTLGWKGAILVIILNWAFIGVLAVSFPILTTQPQPVPTPIECIDSKLYEVSYQGNIKILDRSAFKSCEILP